VAELEEARAIGELAKKGFKPKRTMVYCAWDGEEPSLLGSTEWVEYHQAELKQKAVAYINSDGNDRGFIGASGSHTLETFFNEIADNVMDPQTGVSIKERRYAKTMVDADKDKRAKTLGNKHIKLEALGAGSDYSPFFQHLGITCIDLGFGGEGDDGQYHSIYDSYDLFTRFKDPGFAYGVALSKTAGRISMRLANADVLPIDFNTFYKTVNDYAAEVKTLLDNARAETEMEQKMKSEKLFDLANDPKKVYHAPKDKDIVPFLNFSSLDNALVGLKTTSEAFQTACTKATQLPLEKRQQLNAILYKSERDLLQEKGLPRRAWYRHQIYAPGYYTGYGVKTLPGIREGIEERHWQEAQERIDIVAKTVENYTKDIQKAVDLLK
jgi:N-acetylated-alpha-linked acidic dipeptidase